MCSSITLCNIGRLISFGRYRNDAGMAGILFGLDSGTTWISLLSSIENKRLTVRREQILGRIPIYQFLLQSLDGLRA
jgi:hypothetical protein